MKKGKRTCFLLRGSGGCRHGLSPGCAKEGFGDQSEAGHFDHGTTAGGKEQGGISFGRCAEFLLVSGRQSNTNFQGKENYDISGIARKDEDWKEGKSQQLPPFGVKIR